MGERATQKYVDTESVGKRERRRNYYVTWEANYIAHNTNTNVRY